MTAHSPGPELQRAFAWMAEVGADDALRERDAQRLHQTARHAALLAEREGAVGGPLWDEAGEDLLLASWLAERGVTGAELASWEAAGGEGGAGAG